MTTGESICAGCLTGGLILGAMSGEIIMLLIPIAIGTAGFGILFLSRWYKKKNAISSRIPYPPYGY